MFNDFHFSLRAEGLFRLFFFSNPSIMSSYHSFLHLEPSVTHLKENLLAF
jgi:hypothetical protein